MDVGVWMLLDYKRNRRHETESVFGRREVRKRGRERERENLSCLAQKRNRRR